MESGGGGARVLTSVSCSVPRPPAVRLRGETASTCDLYSATVHVAVCGTAPDVPSSLWVGGSGTSANSGVPLVGNRDLAAKLGHYCSPPELRINTFMDRSLHRRRKSAENWLKSGGPGPTSLILRINISFQARGTSTHIFTYAYKFKGFSSNVKWL